MKPEHPSYDGNDLWESCLARTPKGMVITVCAEAGLGPDDINTVLSSRDFDMKYRLIGIDGERLTAKQQASKLCETRLNNIETAKRRGRSTVLTFFSTLLASIPSLWLADNGFAPVAMVVLSTLIAFIFDSLA